jgi:ribosomal protein L21E
MTDEEKINELFLNPEYGLSSANKLYHKLKHSGITHKQIKDFLAKHETSQISKRITKPKEYLPIMSYGPNDIIQCDILDISNMSTANSGYKYLLLAIDIFTRVAFAVKLKTKNAHFVSEAMQEVIKTFKPNKVEVDMGKEFTSHDFQDLLKKHNIKIIYVDVGEKNKLGVINRFCLTIRTMINKYCLAYKTTRFIDVIEKLINNYNNTYHSTLKTTPNNASNETERINNLYTSKYLKVSKTIPKYKIGDQVRHIIDLDNFEKGSNSRYSKDTFLITEIKGNTYKLSDNKWYKYYHIQPTHEIIKTANEISKEPTREEMKKQVSFKRKLNKEGIQLSDITTSKKTRAQQNEHIKQNTRILREKRAAPDRLHY